MPNSDPDSDVMRCNMSVLKVSPVKWLLLRISTPTNADATKIVLVHTMTIIRMGERLFIVAVFLGEKKFVCDLRRRYMFGCEKDVMVCGF